MNREQYRAQVDALSFSSDFQDRTMARLAQEKERKPMKKMNLKAVLLAAAVVAAMSVTAYAAITLAPRDVAQRAGNEALAAAFEGEDAITVNETKTVGDYNVTLMGLVSGTGLSRVESLPDSVDQDKTYAVLAYARTDGADITEDVPDLTVSPLVEGYAPWRLNAWTLGGGVSSFAQEGVLYYLFECDNVEPFADHTVYLAVYPGTHTPPSAELFGFEDATGVITSKGEAALFSLPLDESKANAQKAEELAGIWDQPQPAAPQTSGEALPADGEFIIWSDGETESVIVIE
ncbi:MAG: hypothetical protein HFF03_07130 [Oscillospiraceae bacterium]|jgi:hypothetical protein|nr:hypothetical protein [Oscillospiraceae bacterium]